jgi:hypothetical protein
VPRLRQKPAVAITGTEAGQRFLLPVQLRFDILQRLRESRVLLPRFDLELVEPGAQLTLQSITQFVQTGLFLSGEDFQLRQALLQGFCPDLSFAHNPGDRPCQNDQ